MYYGFFLSNPIKVEDDESVVGLDVSSTGEMRVLFYFDGKLYGFSSNSASNTLLPLSFSIPITFDFVAENGNTPEFLQSAEWDYSFLNGKKFRLYVAVGDEKAPPKFTLKVKKAKNGVQKTEVIESGEYNIHGDIQSIAADSTDNVTIEVSGYKNDKWLPYVALDKAGVGYKKVKFRATLTINELGEKAELKSVTLKAQPKDIVIPSDEVSIYTKRPLKDAKVYVVGNNKGIIKAFCSSTTPAQWREIERLTATSFDGANGILKLTLTQDGEEVPEIEGLVIQE